MSHLHSRRPARGSVDPSQTRVVGRVGESCEDNQIVKNIRCQAPPRFEVSIALRSGQEGIRDSWQRQRQRLGGGFCKKSCASSSRPCVFFVDVLSHGHGALFHVVQGSRLPPSRHKKARTCQRAPPPATGSGSRVDGLIGCWVANFSRTSTLHTARHTSNGWLRPRQRPAHETTPLSLLGKTGEGLDSTEEVPLQSRS